MSRLHGKTQKKILLLLQAGVALAMSRTVNRQWHILKEVNKEWKDINKRDLERAIKSLYKSNLLAHKNNVDGTTTIVINKNGKKVALTYDLENIIIKKSKWDQKWRIVMFDIPEKYKKTRDLFRYHLKRLGFFEYQKSVFVVPYHCERELEYIRELLNIKRFVRIILAEKFDDVLNLKKHFKLL